MEEYDKIEIQQICSNICSGGTPKSTVAEYYGGNIPWLNTKEINFCRIYKTEKTITDEGFNNSSAKWIPANSVIVAMYGATAGKTAITRIPLTTNQACCNLTIDSIKADYRFVYYALCNDYAFLSSLANGGAQQNLNAQQIKEFEIPFPSLRVQKCIADILSSIDDKIELNRRINDNLEQQAQALFKAWFVDFEPFKDGNFVDSELGRIPEGWQVGQLDELIEIKYGKDHKKLLSGNIPVYGSGGIMRYVNMPIYEKESVLIPRKGSLNNVLYVNHPFWTVDTMFYTRMKINGIAKFIYLFISPIDLLSMNSGSAVPSMTTDILSKIRLVIPPKNIFDNFESLIAPFFEKIDSCNKEIYKLSNLRDALLPKLMSGELSINTITE